MTNGDLKHWIGGFICGEGYFGVGKRKDGKTWVQFSIDLHENDQQVLLAIQRVLGGTTYKHTKRNAFRYSIIKRSEIQNLITFCDKYLFDSNKKVQFIVWKQKVIESNYLNHKK